MTAINSASLLSGLEVQQKYGVSRISGDKTNRSSIRATVTPDGDTVQISSEAWALFHAQSADKTAETQPSAAGDDYPMPPEENASDATAEILGSSTGVDEQIGQMKTEMSRLEGEIAALEEKSETDEYAAAVLVRKRAQLQTLQARLTGLLARSSMSLA